MTVSAEAREKLARHIDSEAWILHDVPGMDQRPEAQKLLVQKSLEIADSIIESGLMASETWDRAEYFRAMDAIKRATSEYPWCTDIYGDVKHAVKCTYWPDTAMSGHGCITQQAYRHRL
mgnify:CR=1 FL=1